MATEAKKDKPEAEAKEDFVTKVTVKEAEFFHDPVMKAFSETLGMEDEHEENGHVDPDTEDADNKGNKAFSRVVVEIGPIRMKDIGRSISEELNKLLISSQAFDIHYDRVWNSTDGKIGPKTGYIRLPFEFRSSTYMIRIHTMLLGLKIPDRKISVDLPEDYMNCLEKCRTIAKDLKEKRQQIKEELKKKIYVNNIPPDTTEDQLKEVFPEATIITICKTESGEQKGYAELIFPSKEPAIECKRKKEYHIGEHTVRCDNLPKDHPHYVEIKRKTVKEKQKAAAKRARAAARKEQEQASKMAGKGRARALSAGPGGMSFRQMGGMGNRMMGMGGGMRGRGLMRRAMEMDYMDPYGMDYGMGPDGDGYGFGGFQDDMALPGGFRNRGYYGGNMGYQGGMGRMEEEEMPPMRMMQMQNQLLQMQRNLADLKVQGNKRKSPFAGGSFGNTKRSNFGGGGYDW